MKLIVDMNLSPDVVPVLLEAGHEAIHWSTIGRPDAPDTEILAWAVNHEAVVMTLDHDFTDLVITGRLNLPSIVLIQVKWSLIDDLMPGIIRALAAHAEALRQGAIVVVDPLRQRVRLLDFSEG